MAFATALLSAPHCIPSFPFGTHRPLGLKTAQSRSALTSSSPSSSSSSSASVTVPVRAEDPRISSIASGSSREVSISRREAALQVISGAGGFLATGVAACAALGASPAPAYADGAAAAESKPRPKFYDLDGPGGVKALDIREGTGATPQIGEKVAIHYYARLAAKQGWRFDSSYDHKDQSGAPEPYVFVIGDGTVIRGLDTALRTMKEGGVRRVVIPPSQGYQNTTQGPIPPNFSDRQRLYTTIFNPTRLANGEGSTLGILVFDIELLGIRPN